MEKCLCSSISRKRSKFAGQILRDVLDFAFLEMVPVVLCSKISEQHVIRTQIRTFIWVIRDPFYGALIYQVRNLLKTRMQLKWSQNLAAHSFLQRDFTAFNEGFRATILMRCRRRCKFPLCPPLGTKILQFTVIPASNHLVQLSLSLSLSLLQRIKSRYHSEVEPVVLAWRKICEELAKTP